MRPLTLLTLLVVGAVARAAQDSPSDREKHTAELLDALVQPRFQVVDPSRGFGFNRVDPPRQVREINGHRIEPGRVLQPENAEEKAKLKEIDAQSSTYTLGFVHLGFGLDRLTGKHLGPLEPMIEWIGKHGEASESTEATQKRESLEAAILEQVPTLKRGKSLEFTSTQGRVFARPVRAGRAACVACHKSAHVGQTMGVMLYWVTASPLASPVRAASSSAKRP